MYPGKMRYDYDCDSYENEYMMIDELNLNVYLKRVTFNFVHRVL